MVTLAEQKYIRGLIYVGAVAISLFLTPNFSSEPVDLPKLLLLATLGGALFSFLMLNLKMFAFKKFRVILILLGLLLLNFTFLLVNGAAPFNQQFYGTFGRNTGYIAYVSLILVFLSTQFLTSAKTVRNVIYFILATAIANCLYGFLQTTGNDPIKWNNPYNSLIGFLGNPDFASAFLGIGASTVFSLLLSKSISNRNKALIAFYELVSLYLIIKSHAQQGLIVMGAGIALSLLIYLVKSKKISRVFLYLYLIVISLFGTVILLGIFKIGPLAEKLYKVSVRQRGFYWHAALEMMKKNPFSGIGIDSYGDNYLQYRSRNAEFFSSATQSNAAHNVFLDIGSNGGFPLLLIYVAINVYVAYRAVIKFRKSKEFEPFFVGAVVAWVGYQAQSIISINQLGLAIWGWILGGLIVGYSFVGESEAEVNSNPKRRAKAKNSLSGGNIFLPLLGGLLGFLLVLPMFQADHSFRLATASRNANDVIVAATKNPIDVNRTLNAAQLLANSHLGPQALELAKKTVAENPKFYNGWVLISQVTDPQSNDHKLAIKRMQELNPRDKKIK